METLPKAYGLQECTDKWMELVKSHSECGNPESNKHGIISLLSGYYV